MTEGTQFKAETFQATNGATVEVGTVTHNGQDFAAMGSIVDESTGVIVGYPKGDTLTSWDGKPIDGLRLCVTSSWRTPRSFLSNRQYAYRATYKGKHAMSTVIQTVTGSP